MKYLRLLVIIFQVSIVSLCASPQIVFYIQRPPLKVLNSLKGVVSQKYLDSIKPSGFPVFYSGYVDYSDEDGRVAFSFSGDQKQPIQLIVSDEFKLVRIGFNTVGYKVIPQHASRATLYTFERKQDKNKFWYWHVQQKEIALGKALRKKPIVILADPDNVCIKPGDFKSYTSSTNVMLPYNIYALSNKGNDRLASDSLDIQRFFEPVETQIAVPTPTISQENITN